MLEEKLLSAVVSFIFSLLLWLIQYTSQRKASLVYYYGGMNNFSFPQEGKPPSNIYTHSLIIANIGKLAAEKLEIYQNIIPIGFSITPEIKWSVEPNKGDQFKHIINIDYLEPGGQIILSYLYSQPFLPHNFISKIRCKDGEGKQISVLPVRQFPIFVNYLFQIIFIVGIFTLIYLFTRYILLRVLGIF